MPYTLRLFGTFELTDPSGTSCTEVLSQPKRAALLAYLAAAQPFGYQRRDRLLAMFWPESSRSDARRALNQSVHFLRRYLGADSVTSRGSDEVGLATGVVECDTVAFHAALDREHWGEALALYRGDLLDGFFVSDLPEFERWQEEVRVGYRDAAIRAAWALSHASLARHELDEARRWARWAAARAPYDESSFRQYLTLLGRVGDRAAAVQAYADFASNLHRELDVAPSRETKELADAIRDGTVPLAGDVDLRPVVNEASVAAGQGPGHLARDSGSADRLAIPAHATVAGTGVPGMMTAALWSRIALIGTGAATTMGVVYLLVIQFGLPTWLLAGATTLIVIGFTVLAAVAVLEHRRASSVLQADGTAGGIHEWLNWRRAVRTGVVVWGGLGLVSAGYVASRVLGIGPAATLFGRGVLEQQDEILIAEFANQTGDSLLGHALTEALRIDLSQSRAVRLVDPDRIAAALQRMSLEPESVLDARLARGVAQRLGVKAVLSGEITPVGTGYALKIGRAHV